MLLTITYTGKNTQELGFLLHKNPYRPQSFELSFGKAHVFYPELSNERTTAALLIELDPIELAKGKSGTDGLFDYVNDRPYVCSSFMSTAISKVFGTAMSGKCAKKQELADTPISLTANLYELPCRGSDKLIAELFEPLGYSVSASSDILDERFPEWGNSRYYNVALSATVTLSQLLNHLYVLIPVFDRQKHYYFSEDEVEKLLSHGKGWLAEHPARDIIVSRYFARRRSYANLANSRLDENGFDPTEDGQESDCAVEPPETVEKKRTLNARRLEAVKNEVLACGAATVLDIGCGECRLTGRLLDEKQIRAVTAADVSVSVLERAKQHLHYESMNPHKKAKLTLLQASLTYTDDRMRGFDCACVVEVIEHIDSARMPAFEGAIFGYAKPQTVIVTTPNREYNTLYGMPNGKLRHDDHRFEWTRDQFRRWAEKICSTYGYTAEIKDIGDPDETLGAPTQMGVFTKCE